MLSAGEGSGDEAVEGTSEQQNQRQPGTGQARRPNPLAVATGGHDVDGDAVWEVSRAAARPPSLIDAVVGNIERLTADGGYDRLEVYEAASRASGELTQDITNRHGLKTPFIGIKEHSGGD